MTNRISLGPTDLYRRLHPPIGEMVAEPESTASPPRLLCRGQPPDALGQSLPKKYAAASGPRIRTAQISTQPARPEPARRQPLSWQAPIVTGPLFRARLIDEDAGITGSDVGAKHPLSLAPHSQPERGAW